MVKITFIEYDGTERAVEAEPGCSLMSVAVRNTVRGIDADCGGACACATCHVQIDAAWIERVGPPSEMEAEILEFADDVTDHSRLSCQIDVRSDLDGLVARLPAPRA